MGITLLERTNPVQELHPVPRRRKPGIASDILAELDELERSTNPTWRPVTGRRLTAASALRAVRPRLDLWRPKAAREPSTVATPEPPSRPEPRRWPQYPVTWNLPQAPAPQIKVFLHRTARWGSAQLPPILVLWKPMLRHTPSNAREDAIWRSFFGHWDVFNDLCKRRARARTKLAALSLRLGVDDAARELHGWCEEASCGVWSDFLGLFSPMEGTVAEHVMNALERLEDLTLL